ncbi:hypothetical protein CUR178_01992 [Leishmania enriettii]|uniref:Uncharacterized protein n=1 Tax=Leishmania enriettii TaxID=5663 RepID=A0A836KDI5_LEIEN|nr:hypothetical protein CUR178_01992 [Leishmania enriettii]
MATPCAPAFAGGGAAASRPHGRPSRDKSDGGRRFPRVVPYTCTTAFLFAPTATGSLSSFSSPRRQMLVHPVSSRQTEASDHFISSTAATSPKSVWVLSPPEAASAALYRSSHLVEPFLAQKLRSASDASAATPAARQPPQVGDWDLRGAGRDENLLSRARHCTFRPPPSSHRCRPAEAALPSSSGAALVATPKQLPVTEKGGRAPYVTHAPSALPLYRSVALAHARAYRHCSASAAVTAATEELQTEPINTIISDIVFTSSSVCMRCGDAHGREHNARPEFTSTALSSPAPSSSADLSDAQRCGRQKAGSPPAPAHEQQQQGQLRPSGQRVGGSLLLGMVQHEAAGMRTRWNSPLPSLQHVCGEENAPAGFTGNRAPGWVALKRKNTAFAAPPAKPHVDPALLATPFQPLCATAQQTTSPSRHAILTSSQMRQRALPRQASLSMRNATSTTVAPSRNGFRVEDSVHRRLETLPPAPDITLAHVPVDSTHTPHAVASCGVVALEAQRHQGTESAPGEGSPSVSAVSSSSHRLTRTSSLVLPDVVSLPPSLQASPSMARARLEYGDAQEDWCFGRSSSVHPRAEELRKKQALLVAQRGRLIEREEAVAREWLVLGARVQLQHIACQERAAYRLFELRKYPRRFPEASAHSGAIAGAADRHFARVRAAQLCPVALPEERCPLAATPLSAQPLRRSRSASSRPLLRQRTPVAAEAHEEDDEKSRLRSFSLSTSSCRPGCSLPRFSDGRDGGGALHAPDAPASVEVVRWPDAEDVCSSGKEEEALRNKAEGAQEYIGAISYGCHEAAPEDPTASMRPSKANQRMASLQPARTSSPCHEGHDGGLLARIRDLQYEEEDLRFLLTGDCPPPHVFYRWANRYFEGHRASFPSATAEASQTSVQHASLSPEAVERCCSRSFSPPVVPSAYGGAASVVCPPDDGVAARVFPATSRGSSKSPLLLPADAVVTKQADELLLWSEGSSASRHQLCSEHRRAWAMENILSDDDACTTDDERRRAGLAPSRSQSLLGRSECNASGRHAPDPQIFSAVHCPAPLSACTLPSYAALSSSPTPRPISVEGAPPPATSDYPHQRPNSMASGSSSLHKMAPPTEKTYSTPLGSERDAWQTLMDKFIDGLLQTIERK